MHGNQDRVIPGNAATIHSDKPFSGLTRFGSSFLSKFQVSETSCHLLESITIVDTPGVLSGDKQRLGRTYDFSQVTRWFAEHSDLILIFFDAHKLDISDELKEVLEILKPHEDKIRIVLNKSDQVSQQELLRVYGALMWSLGKVVETPEVPRVFISSFRFYGLECNNDNDGNDGAFNANGNWSSLMEKEKYDLLLELEQLPMNSATRRINDLVKRARLAKVHALIIKHLQGQMPTLFGRASKQVKLLENISNEFTKIQQEHCISSGDFPDIEGFVQVLKGVDLCNFPKLSNRQLLAIEDALSVDIPQLLERFPPIFSQLGIVQSLNPFHEPLNNPVKGGGRKEEEEGDEVWDYKKIEPTKYLNYFENLGPKDGKLGGSACRQFFLQSGIPEVEMAHIWTLSDRDKDGQLSLEEFSLMLYLTQLRVHGIQMPPTLPDTMIRPR